MNADLIKLRTQYDFDWADGIRKGTPLLSAENMGRSAANPAMSQGFDNSLDG